MSETNENRLPSTMKAAVLQRPLELTIEERPVPTPAPDEVLVKVMAVGICGSDVHYYEHGKIGPYVVRKPLILGHECAGVVAATGKRATRYKTGDRVAIEPGVVCGRCEVCKSGRYNLCPDVQFLATPPVDGAFAQYISIREDFLFPIPDALSFEEASMNEPLSVGIHACRRARLQPGATVAILGMGPVGLLAVAAVRAFGAETVIVGDLEPIRLEAAVRMGATHAINVREEDAAAAVRRLTGGRGADVAFETAGSSKALQAALASVKRGGRLVVVGLPPQDDVPLNVPFIADNEVDISGVFRYANTYKQGIRILSSGMADFGSLVTDRYPLERAAEAMERARTNKSGSLKVMVYPNGL